MKVADIVGERWWCTAWPPTRTSTAPASPTCCAWSACCPTWPSAIRTNSPADSASASAFAPPPLALEPTLLICDEPVSALDVSIPGAGREPVHGAAGAAGLTYIFIAHDLSVVRHISDRIAVMYLGRIAEIATASEQLYKDPLHPYTQALLAAVPIADPELEARARRRHHRRRNPQRHAPAPGCRFHTLVSPGNGRLQGGRPPLKEMMERRPCGGVPSARLMRITSNPPIPRFRCSRP